MLRFKQPVKKTQAGAALIEFAIIMPFLLLLVVGISEFSYAFYHLNILNKAVQDGARYFSDPLRARKGNIDEPINVTSANITSTGNLVSYGNINTTGTALLPTPLPSTTVYCAEIYNSANPSSSSNIECPDETEHIMVIATYTHNFILGSLLNSLTFGAVPNASYTLTASSVLRVE